MTHVKGENKGKIMLYTLSTCIWCKKTKALLKDMGVEFSYEDVDLLEGEDEEKADAEMAKYSDNVSFPLIVIDGKFFCCGYEEEKLRKKLGK